MTALRTREHLIGGRWMPASGPERVVVRSPHGRRVLAQVALATADDADFGGCKASGVGREHGAAGLHEYGELKCVHGLVPPVAENVRPSMAGAASSADRRPERPDPGGRTT